MTQVFIDEQDGEHSHAEAAIPAVDTADIFADAPPSTCNHGTFSHTLNLPCPSTESAPKRERTKDTSPMAQAKLATTQLRVLDARKGRALQARDRLNAEIEKLDEQRDQYVLTLDDKVIAILKAGGVL